VADGSNKTTATEGDVGAFLDAIADEQRRGDAHLLVDLMREVTGQSPVMWGTSIIGFGARHYRYPSGREGDTAAVGFSPRKAQTVLYLTGGLDEYEDLLARLGAAPDRQKLPLPQASQPSQRAGPSRHHRPLLPHRDQDVTSARNRPLEVR